MHSLQDLHKRLGELDGVIKETFSEPAPPRNNSTHPNGQFEEEKPRSLVRYIYEAATIPFQKLMDLGRRWFGA